MNMPVDWRRRFGGQVRDTIRYRAAVVHYHQRQCGRRSAGRTHASSLALTTPKRGLNYLLCRNGRPPALGSVRNFCRVAAGRRRTNWNANIWFCSRPRRSKRTSQLLVTLVEIRGAAEQSPEVSSGQYFPKQIVVPRQRQPSRLSVRALLSAKLACCRCRRVSSVGK